MVIPHWDTTLSAIGIAWAKAAFPHIEGSQSREGINTDDHDVFVVKSRVHFRRGFDETGYAKTIMVVDAPGDWFGTTRLDALGYQHAPIINLYPFRESDTD